MEACWRPRITRDGRSERTAFGWAVTAQQSCATLKDRRASVEDRGRVAMVEEKGRLKLPFSGQALLSETAEPAMSGRFKWQENQATRRRRAMATAATPAMISARVPVSGTAAAATTPSMRV